MDSITPIPFVHRDTVLLAHGSELILECHLSMMLLLVGNIFSAIDQDGVALAFLKDPGHVSVELASYFRGSQEWPPVLPAETKWMTMRESDCGMVGDYDSPLICPALSGLEENGGGT